MKKVSIWARDHIWLSRLIIIFIIYPLLNLTGWFLGDVLYLNGIRIHWAWVYPLSIVCLLLFLIYPSKSNKHKYKNFYNRRKLIDVSLICSTFFLIIITGNNLKISGYETGIATNTYATNLREQISSPGPSSQIKKDKKKFIKTLVQTIRKKYREADNGGKAGLIILAILIAILVAFGLAALTCTIACSGSEALAFIVFILGLTGIIFLLVRAIKKINKRGEKNPATIRSS